MFKRLLGFAERPNQAVIDALYERIVAAARQPLPYADWGVPDTPLGRFEMVSLHLFLFLHRVRGESAPMPEMAQELVDAFFQDIDHSIRELGISDTGVPKRMKRLAKMFYGRVAAYGEALDASDRPALEAALKRNIRPDAAEWAEVEALAGYVENCRDALAGQNAPDFATGRLTYPQPTIVSSSEVTS